MTRQFLILTVSLFLLTACDSTYTSLQLELEVKPGTSLAPELNRLARLSLGKKWKAIKTSVDGKRVTLRLGKIRRDFTRYRLLLRTLDKIKSAGGTQHVPRYQLNLTEGNPAILEVLRLKQASTRKFPFVLNTDSIRFRYDYHGTGARRRAHCQVQVRTVGYIPSLRYIRTLRGSRYTALNRVLSQRHYYARHTTEINARDSGSRELIKLIRYRRENFVTFDFGVIRLSGQASPRPVAATEDSLCRHAILLDSYPAFYRSVLFPALGKRLLGYRIRTSY